MGETSCVTWGKCLNLSESRFLHLSSRSQGLGRYLHNERYIGAHSYTPKHIRATSHIPTG